MNLGANNERYDFHVESEWIGFVWGLNVDSDVAIAPKSAFCFNNILMISLPPLITALFSLRWSGIPPLGVHQMGFPNRFFLLEMNRKFSERKIQRLAHWLAFLRDLPGADFPFWNVTWAWGMLSWRVRSKVWFRLRGTFPSGAMGTGSAGILVCVGLVY